MNRSVFAAVVVSGGFLVLAAAPALGAPADPVVPAHQHYVVTPEGNVPIGPNACRDGMSLGFDHFHLNVHRGVPGTMGTVTATACP